MRSITLNKKGGTEILVPAILTLILGAAILVFGLVILGDLQPITATETTTTVNETLTTVDYAGEVVAGTAQCGFKDFVVVAVTNKTNGNLITSGNYSYTQDGRIRSITSGMYNNSNWNVTYSYYYGQDACKSTNKTTSGLGSFADFWEIIVLAIVITIVIGLLMAVFSKRRVQ